MTSEVTTVEWHALYAAAAKFREIEPWAWVNEEDIFGVRNPETGEIGYCCVMGELGEVLGMAVYLGTGGLKGYLAVHDGAVAPDDGDAMFIQDCLLVTYENKSALEKEDKALIKKLGIQAKGRRAWPMFRRHKPSFFPWFLEKEEVDFLTKVLEQAREVCLRLGEDETLSDSPKEGLYLVRTYNEAHDQWEDAWLPPAALPETAPQTVRLDELAIQRIRKNVQPSKAVWEIDTFYVPAPVFEGDRPSFPYAILIADEESGLVHDVHFAAPGNAPAEFPGRILNCIEKGGMLPAKILVRRQETADMVSPVAEKFGIGLRMVARLSGIEQARRSLESHLLK